MSRPAGDAMTTRLAVEPIGTPIDALRIPRVDAADPLDAAVGAANDRARNDSLSVLAEVLPAVPFAELAQTADGSVVSGSCAASGVLRQWVDGPALLDRLLATHDIGTDHHRLVRDRTDLPVASMGERVHGEAGLATRLVAGPLLAQLNDGATLVMNVVDLQDRALIRFTEHVERVFGCQVNINGYLGFRSDPGFDAHWDDHEVFVIQLIGRKEWEVHEPPVLSANRSTTARDTSGRVAWKGVVGPGGVLHVPRGWGHDARATDELTFHLTVGVPRVSNLDLIDDMVDRLPAHPAGRALVPDLAAIDQTSWRPRLRDLVTEVSTPEAVAWALARRWGGLPSRSTQSVRAALGVLQGRIDTADVFVRAPHPGGVLLANDEPGRRRVVFGGCDASVGEAALEVLAPRLDGRAHRMADVVAAAPRASGAAQVVREAIAVGLLEVVEDLGAWGVVTEPVGSARRWDGSTADESRA